MTDYFSPTVIQPAIPIADMTPLERVLLTHIFNAELDGGTVYFYADEKPADMIWLDRAPLEAALVQSQSIANSRANTIVTGQLARIPADNVEIELDLSDMCWQEIFQDIVRRSATLRYITAVSAYTCDKMKPDGFGGMVVLITASAIYDKDTNEILQDFLNQAVPGWAAEHAAA